MQCNNFLEACFILLAPSIRMSFTPRCDSLPGLFTRCIAVFLTIFAGIATVFGQVRRKPLLGHSSPAHLATEGNCPFLHPATDDLLVIAHAWRWPMVLLEGNAI